MKTKKRLSTKRMLSNNFFLLRLMFQGTPFYAFSIVVEAIRHNLVNFLEQTICVYLILDVIETKKPYTKVLWVVGLFLLLDFFQYFSFYPLNTIGLLIFEMEFQ